MSFINSIQRSLSKAQATPAVGPLIISPGKAVVSVAQIISGVARGVFCGVAALSICCVKSFCEEKYKVSQAEKFFAKQSGYGFLDEFNGTCSLIYSLSNFFTMGITGYVCERSWSELKRA